MTHTNAESRRFAPRTSKIILWASRSCIIYTSFYTIVSLLYFIIVFPSLEKSFHDVLREGISIVRHIILFAVAVLFSGIWTIFSKKTSKQIAQSWIRYYIHRLTIAFTLQIAGLIIVFAFYKDMLYNPYIGISAPILRGPSFLLSIAAMIFSLSLPFVGLILKKQRIPLTFRIICHFSSLSFLFYICYYLIADGFSSSKTFFILWVIAAVCYFLTCLIVLLLHGAYKHDQNENEEYQNIYLTNTANQIKRNNK